MSQSILKNMALVLIGNLFLHMPPAEVWRFSCEFGMPPKTRAVVRRWRPCVDGVVNIAAKFGSSSSSILTEADVFFKLLPVY
jgi:hypothetical protein